MSEKEKVKVITKILESTVAYELGQYDFRFENGNIKVWSKNPTGEPREAFMATDAVIALSPIATGFVQYDSRLRRCEFIIC